MAKVIVQADCGNAPKKILLRDWNIAYAEGNLDFITENVTDDVSLEVVGETRVQGKTAFIEAIQEMMSQATTKLVLHGIITHGKEAAVNGEIHRENGEVVGFCDVYIV